MLLYVYGCSIIPDEVEINSNTQETDGYTVCFDTINKELGFNSMCISYDSDSTLFARSFLIDTILHGPDIRYYSNGNVKFQGYYIKGKKMGLFAYFDKNEKVIESFDYLGDHLNQYGVYNKGLIDTLKSNFRSLELSSDTISIGDSVNLKITLHHKMYKDSFFLHIGKLNQQLTLSELKLFKLENKRRTNIFIKPPKKGVHYIEGYTSDLENNSKMFFSTPVFVTN